MTFSDHDVAALLRKPSEELETMFAGRTAPEAVRMLLAVHRGGLMTGGEGWFGPASSRFSFEWLAKRCGRSPTEAISRADFRGPDALFDRLDRNRDDRITADDFDWTESNPWVRQAYQINRYFRRIDARGDGKVSRDNFLAFFDRAAQGKDHLTSGDLRDALLGGTGAGGFVPGDAPTRDQLIAGLLNGELGSWRDGPRSGDPAPDFTLKTHDGSATVRLSDIVGPKPVVLVFGNFTCGPFRSMYPEVDAVASRFRDVATFLGIYVREAHPTDGWVMISNTRVGVSTSQPKTYDERAAVATRCRRLIKPSIPLLVDTIDDAVGHAYSGMPARLYVIDRAGTVAYQGGRGPFGFKPGEMEQALVMLLIEQSGAAAGRN